MADVGTEGGQPSAKGRKARDVELMEGEVPRRLRAERERRGMSVRELARRLDLSPSAISQIETGRARPSVSTLYAIVTELGMSLDGLFGPVDTTGAPDTSAAAGAIGKEAAADAIGAADPASRPDRRPSPAQAVAMGPPLPEGGTGLMQRDGARQVLELETGVRWERLTAASDPEVDFLYVEYPPGSASSSNGMLMRHAGREYGVLLSGALEVTVAFDTYVLGPGDSISFASTVPHRLSNPWEEPATGIWVVIGRHGDSGPNGVGDGSDAVPVD
jgi:transcriptional regulator with XRE-family HTH domain